MALCKLQFLKRISSWCKRPATTRSCLFQQHLMWKGEIISLPSITLSILLGKLCTEQKRKVFALCGTRMLQPCQCNFNLLLTKMHCLLSVNIRPRYTISGLFMGGQKRLRYSWEGKTETLKNSRIKKKKKKNPGSNKEKLLCEDSRLSTGFVSLKFSLGIVSKYHISLILGCIVPYTLETQIPMGLAIVTSINSSTDFLSDI